MAMTSRLGGPRALLRLAILGPGLSLLVIGCNGSADFPTGRVHGRVTYEGVPFQEGEVSVYSAELGVGASSELASDGTFVIGEPLRAGRYTVTVFPPSEPPRENSDSVPRKQESSNIPRKYQDPQQSGLTLEVVEGDNRLEVNMTR